MRHLLAVIALTACTQTGSADNVVTGVSAYSWHSGSPSMEVLLSTTDSRSCIKIKNLEDTDLSGVEPDIVSNGERYPIDIGTSCRTPSLHFYDLEAFSEEDELILTIPGSNEDLTIALTGYPATTRTITPSQSLSNSTIEGSTVVLNWSGPAPDPEARASAEIDLYASDSIALPPSGDRVRITDDIVEIDIPETLSGDVIGFTLWDFWPTGADCSDEINCSFEMQPVSYELP